MSVRLKAKRAAFIEDYLKLCSEYGLVIDCGDSTELHIQDIMLAPEKYPGYNMPMYVKYMKGLV